MSDDVVRIIPAEEQSAEELAAALSKTAAAQGLEDEVQVDGEEVIVPRSLRVDSRAMPGFPPSSGPYVVPGPVELIDKPR